MDLQKLSDIQEVALENLERYVNQEPVTLTEDQFRATQVNLHATIAALNIDPFFGDMKPIQWPDGPEDEPEDRASLQERITSR